MGKIGDLLSYQDEEEGHLSCWALAALEGNLREARASLFLVETNQKRSLALLCSTPSEAVSKVGPSG
jgi:hypothetical protein